MTHYRKKKSDALLTYQHRRFVLALHKRLTALEPLKEATTTAYRETILRAGSKLDEAVVDANARRLRNKPGVKAELERLLEQATTWRCTSGSRRLSRSRKRRPQPIGRRSCGPAASSTRPWSTLTPGVCAISLGSRPSSSGCSSRRRPGAAQAAHGA